MNKALKIILWCVGALAVILAATGLIAGNYMVKYALTPEEQSFDMDEARQDLRDYTPDLGQWLDSLENAGVMRDTAVAFEDGRTMHALFAAADNASKKSAVIVHGYTSNPIWMMRIGRMFRDSLGYNILLPYLNHHGLSDGEAIQMGWKDRLDVEKWIEIAHEKFADTLEVVQGISMGGATTMMVSGDPLPEYVRGFVEDCGYTSAWDQFAKELKEQFNQPPFPVLYGASLVCRCKYGWGFKEASSVKQLAKCTLPMLFIHGDSDDFVPTAMLQQNFDAKTQGYKEMWLAPDTSHGMAYDNHPAEYTARVRKFLAEHVE